jgi:two-component system, LytTR family, sensor kinase
MKKSVVVLLHLGYWLLYIFIVIMLIHTVNSGKVHLSSRQIAYVLFFFPLGAAAFIPGIIGFYTFYGVLFDRFLKKKKILRLILSAVVISLLAAIVTQFIMYVAFPPPRFHINWDFNTCVFAGLFFAFISVVHGIIGLVMKGFITWYEEIKTKADLDKKNYEMELALMKAQINPHFLFNTINNIDVLIQKDAVKASEYLNKLSSILRFMLYETKTEKIALATELSYIEKYIELQKIRTANSNYIKYEVKGGVNNLSIAPMLFIPFIENAFKHSENKKVENAINVLITIEKEKIVFECENAYSLNAPTDPEHNGLGNKLIQKRLALLYPNKNSFEITNKNGIYKVHLEIAL